MLGQSASHDPGAAATRDLPYRTEKELQEMAQALCRGDAFRPWSNLHPSQGPVIGKTGGAPTFGEVPSTSREKGKEPGSFQQ